MTRAALRLALPALLVLLTSCAPVLQAVIYDSNGLQKEVTAIRTDTGDLIDVLDGLAYRKLPLDKITSLFVSPAQTLTRDGELYYQVEIWLYDGTKIQPYVMPDGTQSTSYVNINGRVIGDTQSGPYTIKFKDIRQIRFLEPPVKTTPLRSRSAQ